MMGKTLHSISLIAAAVLCTLIFSPAQENNAEMTRQNMQMLVSGKGSALINKPIVLWRVTVEAWPDTSATAPKNKGVNYPPAFWVGQRRDKSVLVAIPDGLVPVDRNDQTSKVRKGDRVDITGTVRAAPDKTQLMAVYSLNAAEVQIIEREGVIVEAGAVVVRPSR